MKVEQIYTGCLAQGAYYIQSGDEVAIIDPLREVDNYIQKAEKNGAKIKYVLETHFHADFVSGHLDLAKKTGAKIVFGTNALPEYEAHIAQDGEILILGNTKIKVIHTPGHTMESATFLLFDEQGKEYAIFTGDTLFIGDVGRPDLAVKSNLSQEDLAGHLYESLKKLTVLPDEVIVYPAHGAGSACGKNMSKETFDTLGHQKQVNYALQPMSKEEFIEKVLDGLAPPPYYFPQNVMMNKKGYVSFDEVMNTAMNPLNPEELEMVVEAHGALVLDTRKPDEFVKGFIPRSISIGVNGDFAPWVGTLITDIKQPLVIVVEDEKLEEVITRLARVGYENVLGYLKGGFDTWKKSGKEIDTIESITAQTFEERLQTDKTAKVIDVRKSSEYTAQHVEGANFAPLAQINEHLADFEENKTNYIHCAGGYRSVIAASILKARGIHNIVNIAGGFKAIEQTNIPKTSFICTSTMSQL
ncbi:MAG: MBL fold metallo-hydrolase [Raineya sp.]|jgi:glyoxylase-like metal-dependent hydrolase (beta-lactamase superfamily II)/rhodanese-related sulfurtransferase|nr:MBL fold metallo-hydrolase [Raineya sp.]